MATAVDPLNGFRFVRRTGGREAVVVPGIQAGKPHCFGFDDDAAAVRPFPSCIARLAGPGFGFGCLARFHSELLLGTVFIGRLHRGGGMNLRGPGVAPTI